MTTKAQLIEALNAGTITHSRYKVTLQQFVGMAVRNAKFTPISSPEKFPVKVSQPKFSVVCQGEEITALWEYDNMYFECSDGVLAYHVEGEHLF